MLRTDAALKLRDTRSPVARSDTNQAFDGLPPLWGREIFATFTPILGLGIFAVPAAIKTTARLEAKTMLAPRDLDQPDETKNGD
ncbi:MAG: hypothetical protein ACRBCL_07425 [Maritimibacter sp.]